MNQILYATDRSEHSIKALRYVADLAARLGSKLHLLNVYSLPPIEHNTIRTHMQLKRNAYLEQLDLLKQYWDSCLSMATSVTDVNFLVVEGSSISKSILSSVEELSAEMVIVGRKDEHSDRGLFAGNIANALLYKLACPLLIIPNTIAISELKNIVYASDFEADDIKALVQLETLVQKFEATLKVVHIPTKDEYASDEQLDWFKEIASQNMSSEEIDYHLILSDSVHEGLKVFIKKNKADLLAMLERDEKGFFERLLRGDMVKRMKTLSDIPLLCFNRKCFS